MYRTKGENQVGGARENKESAAKISGAKCKQPFSPPIPQLRHKASEAMIG